VSPSAPDPLRVSDPVHYVSWGTPPRADGSQAFPSLCRAARVTEIDPEDPNHLGLEVANPSGTFFHPLALGGCHPGDQGGQWHRVH
jgi:hypothetical protein